MSYPVSCNSISNISKQCVRLSGTMLAASVVLFLAASPLLVSGLVLQEGGVLAYHDAAVKSSSGLYNGKDKKPLKSEKAYIEGTDAADGNTDKTKEEQESERIEKECEEQMKTKLNVVDSNDDDEPNVQQEHEKDCFFQCLFQKHNAADEKGNVVEKNVIIFFLKNSPFKDKAKLNKITGECIKKAKDEGKIKEADVCNPFSNYVYHCIYEDMHMEM
ncbi:hypothetical protein C0J52_04648 [Blattella germanica]|nr:hypothetical protein C0J52_04648 [Blattella germanica]